VCGFAQPQGTKVWDAQSGERVATLAPDNAIVQFSPDDRFLVAGTRSHYHLFRATDWKELWRMPRDGALYSAGPCAFSPDSRQLAVAKSRQTAALLATDTGRELDELVAPRPATIKTFRWSQDGQRLVMGTAENMIQVWELEALQASLASLGLSRATVAGAEAARSASPFVSPGGRRGLLGALVLGLFAAGLVSLVALLALRRHRRLIEEVARSEALADQRERELQIEREVSRLKSTFVSMVSHEFRTPLGVITASAGNLQRYMSRLTETQRAQLFTDIANSSRRMTDLIEEVLLLGKVESGSMKCQAVWVDLPSLCRRVVGDVTLSNPKGVAIELAADTLNGEVQLDETLTHIILTNLLSNAVKYSPNGKAVSLRVRREGCEAVFEVCDQGIGIPAADQLNLFTSFHRSRNVAGIPGSGLGLTIVKRCIDLQGGTISFKSVEGSGSTFVARIPAFPLEA
jgi:signal transduction histidine kinase